jgi:hypothetical protein
MSESIAKAGSNGNAPAATVRAAIDMTVGGRRLSLKVSVPAGPIRVADLLPVAQQLANKMAAEAV